MIAPAPPARLSILVDHVDWDVAGRIEVLLDGQRATRVVAYDAIAGTVVRHQTDDEGKLKICPFRRETIKETLTGKVEPRWKE